MSSPIVEARIRDIQSRAQDRRDKREEAAAEKEERETRQTISPNDVIAKERAAANWKYWCDIDDRRQERERQEKIAEANPKLIAWKTEYMACESSSRRAILAQQFVELYRRAYRKDVPVAVVKDEWDAERRKATLARIYGAQ